MRTAGVALGLAVLSTLAEEKTTDVLAGLGHRPSPAERADALLEGFQVAFTVAAILDGGRRGPAHAVVRRKDVAKESRRRAGAAT